MKRSDEPLIERLRCGGTLLCRPAYDPTYLCTRCEGAEALEAAEAKLAAIDALCDIAMDPVGYGTYFAQQVKAILHPEES